MAQVFDLMRNAIAAQWAFAATEEARESLWRDRQAVDRIEGQIQGIADGDIEL